MCWPLLRLQNLFHKRLHPHRLSEQGARRLQCEARQTEPFTGCVRVVTDGVGVGTNGVGVGKKVGVGVGKKVGVGVGDGDGVGVAEGTGIGVGWGR